MPATKVATGGQHAAPVLALDDPAAVEPAVAGAKAAALARAAAAGLPVLPGMVLTTAAAALPPAKWRPQLAVAWSVVSDGGRRPVVVRSSSTTEDGARRSMAGVFTSVLDVTTGDGFAEAVRAVLASAVTPGLGLGAAGEAGSPGVPLPMAVLVQPQLDAAVGGVLFGLDPVSGRKDRVVISASESGPAAVVGGLVHGTRYVLSKRGRRVDGPAAGPLPDRSLRLLAALAKRAARLFGGPQDIEWAIGRDGRLWLLQSRPVTATGSEARASGPVLGPGPVAETFPDPLSELEEDLWLSPLRDGLRAALAVAGTVGRRRLAASPVVTTAGGRVAADLELLGEGAHPRSLGRRLDPRPPLRRLLAAWRVGRLRAALPALARDLVEAADRDLLAVPALDGLTDRELVGILDRSAAALTSLHGHEVLMGWLVATSTNATAAGVALRALAEGRAEGLSDAEIVASRPVVLALVPPRIGVPTTLNDHLGTLATATFSDGEAAAPMEAVALREAAVLREALRLRSRWVQELTARVAGELGRRLSDRGALAEPGLVRHLRQQELVSVLSGAPAPRDLFALGRPHTGPLPARFRIGDHDTVVPVARQPRATRRLRRGAGAGAGAGIGAGGGRGSGIVHGGDGLPATGAVMVVGTLEPRLAPLLPRLGGLVAETGSVLSHLAILARELGVPTVVGVDGARDRYPPGTVVVVDGATGDVTPVVERRGAA